MDYIGTANNAIATHIVRDVVSWRSLCGKLIAEAYPADNWDDVTCKRCDSIANGKN